LACPISHPHDKIVDSTAGCDLLCFLDAFFGYYQIKMAREDEEKTAFITPCGVYCYVRMPFDLKNAGATFQRLMHKALGAQMGRNAEAYVDDIVVKTREGHTFIEDQVIPSLKTGRNIRQPEKGKHQAQSR
jgi:hypothetical protein